MCRLPLECRTAPNHPAIYFTSRFILRITTKISHTRSPSERGVPMSPRPERTARRIRVPDGRRASMPSWKRFRLSCDPRSRCYYYYYYYYSSTGLCTSWGCFWVPRSLSGTWCLNFGTQGRASQASLVAITTLLLGPMASSRRPALCTKRDQGSSRPRSCLTKGEAYLGQTG